MRLVSVVIVTEPQENREEIEEELAAPFNDFYKQTGIKFRIKDWKDIRWHAASSRDDLLQQLVNDMRSYKKPYDIAIGFYEMNAGEDLAFSLFGGWMSVIDDEYRRYIVARRGAEPMFVHELGHAFMFEHVHTGGVMSAYSFCMVGDHLCTNSSVCFLDRDRKEIIKNKWRYFNEKPNLNERQDMIEGSFYAKTPLRALYELFRTSRPKTDNQKIKVLD